MTAAHSAGRVAPAAWLALSFWSDPSTTPRGSPSLRASPAAPRSAAAPPLFPRITVCRRRVIVRALRAFTSCIGVPASTITLPPFSASAFVLTVSLRVTTMLAA